MFQFMKKEKTEEEKAEKVKKKSDKRDRKEKKARNASALSSDDLARLAEVRRSLKMSKAETAVLSGITAGSVGGLQEGVVGLSYSQERGEWSASDTSDSASTYSKTGSLSSQGKVRSILKSRGGSSVVSPGDLDDQSLLFKNTLQNTEYTYSGGSSTHIQYTYSGGEGSSSQDRELTYSYLTETRLEVDGGDWEGKWGKWEPGEGLGSKARKLFGGWGAKLPGLAKEEGTVEEVTVVGREVAVRRVGSRRSGVLIADGPNELGLGKELVTVDGEGLEGGREEVERKLGREGSLVLGVRESEEIHELAREGGYSATQVGIGNSEISISKKQHCLNDTHLFHMKLLWF